jgi:hypothetical protein
MVERRAGLIGARPDRHVLGRGEARSRAAKGAAASPDFALKDQPPLEMSDAASKTWKTGSPLLFQSSDALDAALLFHMSELCFDLRCRQLQHGCGLARA